MAPNIRNLKIGKREREMDGLVVKLDGLEKGNC